MESLKEKAQNYEPPKTMNIADLDKVPTSTPIEKRTFAVLDDDGKECQKSIDVIVVEGEDYRVPVSVLKALKSILEEKPEVEFIKVKKAGEGLKTNYTVVTLENDKIPEEKVEGENNAPSE